MKCTYCKTDGLLRVSQGEMGNPKDLYVCDGHWKILQNPQTAIPFIRGYFASEMRQNAKNYSGKEEQVLKLIESLKGLRPRNR